MGTSNRELEGSVILIENNLWLTDSNYYKHFIIILKKNFIKQISRIRFEPDEMKNEMQRRAKFAYI